jgi:hypothetical protein
MNETLTAPAPGLPRVYIQRSTEGSGVVSVGMGFIAARITSGIPVVIPPSIPAARFVSWAQSEGKDTHDSVSDLFYLFSRLVLSLASPDAADVASAPALYDKLVAEEQRVSREMAEEHSPGWPAPAWLFGLYDDFEPESVRRGWARAAVWALDHLRTSGSAELNPGLIELEERLAEQKAAKPYDPC